MALTKLEILNIALDRIGAKGIVAETDQHDSARVALRHYKFILNDLLTRHAWSFAKAKIQLSPNSGTPDIGWRYEFTLPGDFLHIVSVTPVGNTARTPNTPQNYNYEVFDGNIYADVTPILLIYITNDIISNPHKMPPYFGQALAAGIAASMAPVYDPSQAGKQLYAAEASQALRKAIFLDTRMSAKMRTPPSETRRLRSGAGSPPWASFPDPNYNKYPWEV